MRAAVLEALGEMLAVREVESPPDGLGEVLIEVRAVGLCGTDLEITTGAFPGVAVAGGSKVAVVDPPSDRRAAAVAAGAELAAEPARAATIRKWWRDGVDFAKPIIGACFQLADVNEAFSVLRGGSVAGRLVAEPQE